MRLSTGCRVPFAALLLGAAAILASAIAPRDAAALPSKLWLPVTDGFWGVPSNWSPLGVPTGSDSAVVTAGMNGHTLTLDADYSAAALNIQGASTVFELAGHGFSSSLLLSSGIVRASTGVPQLSGLYHSLAGGQTQIYNGVALQAPVSWQNDGHAVVHASAGSQPSEFRMVTYTTLSGAGDLLLNDAANAQITSPSGYTLTQNAAHTIHGSGRIVLESSSIRLCIGGEAARPKRRRRETSPPLRSPRSSTRETRKTPMSPRIIEERIGSGLFRPNP